MNLYQHILKFNDDLLEVVKVMNPSYFITDKTRPNWLNQKLLGLWVDHLDCNRVVRKDGKILICRIIEEAQIVE